MQHNAASGILRVRSMSKIISDEQLQPYHESSDNCLPSRLQAFIRQQHATWPALATAHRQLSKTMRRILRLPDSDIELQYNPGRTRSTTAKVSADDVAQRPCFLCPANLYPEQLALPLSPNWLILNNPFPIFNDHLVISSNSHTDQLLAPALPAMIKLVTDFEGNFSAFYNGARCGASAPDHLHFQACPAGMLPLERQLQPFLDKPEHENTTWTFHTLDNRGVGLCRATSAKELLEYLQTMCAHLNLSAEPGQEAELNLIIFGRRGKLAAACLPRRAHRPACFFASGDDQLVISPGAVDVGGLAILPRQQDFDRMTNNKMLSIYREVCLPADVMAGGEVAS
jgi:hypothetical protein